MKLPRLLTLLVLILPVATLAADPAPKPEAAPATAATGNAAAYKNVNIDDYAAKHRPVKEGTRTLLPPQYIMFNARIDRPPKTARTEYLKLAISVMGISDAPPIGHQMLLATPGGLRLPVYVEDTLVPVLAKAAATKPDGQFHGYHIYTWSQGPAIVISGYLPKQ